MSALTEKLLAVLDEAIPDGYTTNVDVSIIAQRLAKTATEHLTTDVEYAVAHPVTGEPRMAREPLADCRDYAKQFETHILHRHVAPWQQGEPE